MKYFQRILISGCIPVLLVAPFSRADEEMPLFRSVMELLNTRGLIPEGDTAELAAVRGLISRIDPKSRLLAENEREAFIEGLESAASAKDTLKKSEEWPEGICYMALNGLYEDGASNVVERMSDWARNYKTGLIMDLRGAGGSNLDAILEVMQFYSLERTELYEIVSSTNVIPVTAGTNTSFRIPGVVLTDRETSGAAETLAAVLKEQSATLLIGERTSGDDRLREVIPLDGTNSLYIATRWIRMPDGDRYADRGVEPDVALTGAIDRDTRRVDIDLKTVGEEIRAEARRDRELMLKVRHDEALERAVDFLLGLKAVAGR